ncbi:MAG: tetratricopeptide repeat protein [Flavobacteriaceae bacterium]|jgi:tetratricopeptide (TPR) repeat protein|nr:tetratricopeptide repeat protein [Flavobacteriaceae bacterium]
MKAEDWFNKGSEHFSKGEYQEAIECYDKAIDINPDYAEAYNNKGSALGILGKYEEAIECYDKAIELKPDNAEAYYNKGITLSYLGKYQEAVECYDKAIELKPDNAEVYINKGNALSNLGKHQEAIKCFDKAIDLNPDYAEAYYNKGNALGNLGKYQEALKCFDKAIALNPYLAEAYISKGCALYDIGKYEEAIKYFDKAIELKPDYAEAYYSKGLVEERLYKYKEAVGCYEQVLVISPNHYHAAERRNNILKGMSVFEREGYRDEKLKEFDKLLHYGFAVAFSGTDKIDAVDKLDKTMLNNIGKKVVDARLRIDTAVANHHSKTDYEDQIAQCTTDEYPIVFAVYYYLKGEISAETASTLLLYFSKKMNEEMDEENRTKYLSALGDLFKAMSIVIPIMSASIAFVRTFEHNTFTTKIRKLNYDYELFKRHLPTFLKEERERLGEEKFVEKYYLYNHLKEYEQLFK